MRNCDSVLLKTTLLGCLFTLAACGGGGGGSSVAPPNTGAPPTTPPTADSCAVDGQKAFAQTIANDWYLWYDELADVNPDDFDTVNDYLDALTAPLAPDGRDPGFSYMTTIEADQAGFTSGAFVGFGFRSRFLDGPRFFIADALEGGPASNAGFARGVEVLAIDTGNGFETIEELSARGASNDELFGPREVGVQRSFRLRDGDQQFEVTISKRELDTPPLAGGAMLIPREGNTPVGYLHMRGFTDTATDALSEAFTEFAAEGVTDLVIDLRYNGGGLVRVAEDMLNMLGGEIADGELSYIVALNDKQSDQNSSARFAARFDSISPLRIAFITTGSSASASELVINSLAPHVELVLVGEDTFGKAVGQSAFDQPNCENRLRLVVFEIVNGESQGGYYTGLVSSGRFTLCPAEDDVLAGFGDPAEDSLDVALGWLNEGQCGVRTNQTGAAKRLLPAAAGPSLPPWAMEPEIPDRLSPLWQ